MPLVVGTRERLHKPHLWWTVELPSAAPSSWPVVCAGIRRWSPCSCPPFASFIHIYFPIYLSAFTSQGPGFDISMPSGSRWKSRQPRDAGKKGRRDRYPEVRWTISVRLTDPSATSCHQSTTDMYTHTHTCARTRDKTPMAILQQETWTFHSISEKKKMRRTSEFA